VVDDADVEDLCHRGLRHVLQEVALAEVREAYLGPNAPQQLQLEVGARAHLDHLFGRVT